MSRPVPPRLLIDRSQSATVVPLDQLWTRVSADAASGTARATNADPGQAIGSSDQQGGS